MRDTFPPDMSRSDRRRFKALAEDVDRIVQADKRFFERFPLRTHRLRLMSRPEREQLAMVGEATALPTGQVWAVAVKRVPGGRMRAYVSVPIGADLDAPEHICRNIFECSAAASPHGREVENAMHKAFGTGDRAA